MFLASARLLELLFKSRSLRIVVKEFLYLFLFCLILFNVLTQNRPKLICFNGSQFDESGGSIEYEKVVFRPCYYFVQYLGKMNCDP